MASTRKQIIELLEKEECDARMISQKLGIREKEAYDHIPHIIRTVSATGKTFTLTAAQCIDCGYEFRDRKRASKPGRCPACKKERIESPRFSIK
jgi:hypothetical protein